MSLLPMLAGHAAIDESLHPAPPPRVDWLLDATPFRATVVRAADGAEITLGNGLVSRTFRLRPAVATTSLFDHQSGQELLRAVGVEGVLVLNGIEVPVGGLGGQVDHAYLAAEWIDSLTPLPGALRLLDIAESAPQERLAWARVRHASPHAAWPPPGRHLCFEYAMPPLDADVVAALLPDEAHAGAPPARLAALAAVRVRVHCELYDGLPCFARWIEVENAGDQPITLDRFVMERLAIVEQRADVETREGVSLGEPQCLSVETDQAFGGMSADQGSRHMVRWREDPQYASQVNYLRKTPCLLEIGPWRGPAQRLAPGQVFRTNTAIELVQDSTDRERRGLARRRMYRTLAPWVTENPLMHHMRTADPAAVRQAIDDAAAVGFEMLILSFGSGFDIENDAPELAAGWAELRGHARARGIDLGGYSLLASRSVGGGDDVVSAPGEQPTFGNAPALTSGWGRRYFDQLYGFLGATDFSVLEHDGSYPGDWDVTPRPPLQQGLADSQWAQWRIIADFYAWCRGRGIYLNVPDWYFLAGSSKTGMGYREDNWSLPRDQQVIHTRQNIYDGTWEKTPSMGWMFVPLTEYHGGGAAATIEPLHEHLDHYERMLLSNLALGVQACYRGPRLFDSASVRDRLRHVVDWYKAHRDILEGDLIHGRRADGRDVDWMLHVDPRGVEKGMLVVFNPLAEAVTRSLRVPLYYTGLREVAQVVDEAGHLARHAIGRDDAIELTITVPARGMTWRVLR